MGCLGLTSSSSDHGARKEIALVGESKVYLRKDGTLGLKHYDSKTSKIGSLVDRLIARGITYDKDKIRSSLMGRRLKLEQGSEREILQIFTKLYGKQCLQACRRQDQTKVHFFSLVVDWCQNPNYVATQPGTLEILALFQNEKKHPNQTYTDQLNSSENQFLICSLLKLTMEEIDQKFLDEIMKLHLSASCYSEVVNFLFEKNKPELAIYFLNCIPDSMMGVKSEYIEEIGIEQLKLSIQKTLKVLSRLSTDFLTRHSELVDLAIKKYGVEALDCLDKSYPIRKEHIVQAFRLPIKQDYGVVETILKERGFRDFIFPEGSFEKAVQEVIFSQECTYITYREDTRTWMMTSNEADLAVFKCIKAVTGLMTEEERTFGEHLIQAISWNEKQDSAITQKAHVRQRIINLQLTIDSFLTKQKNQSRELTSLQVARDIFLRNHREHAKLLLELESKMKQEEKEVLALHEKGQVSIDPLETLILDWVVVVSEREYAKSKLDALIKERKKRTRDEHAIRLANEALARAERAYVACYALRVALEKEVKVEEQKAKKENRPSVLKAYCLKKQDFAITQLELKQTQQYLVKIAAEIERVDIRRQKIPLEIQATKKQLEVLRNTYALQMRKLSQAQPSYIIV